MRQYTDGKRTVKANSYKEAAEKLFGQTWYTNPSASKDLLGDCGKIPTTYITVHRGYAEVRVYPVGAKQGTWWGVQADFPKRYTIERR